MTKEVSLMNETSSSSSLDQQKLAFWGLVLVALAPSVSVITGFALKAGLISILIFIITKKN